MANFMEKVVLITGASSGIGEATAIKLAEHGASLFLVALEEDQLQIVQQRCMEKGLEEEKQPRIIVYCMIKTAIDMLTKCLAKELGAHGVRVNAINPSFIDGTNILRNSGLKATEEDQKQYAE